MVLFLMILIRTAWVSDDGTITLRSVLNFVHGYGPVFNLTERVQSFTHPLWFLLISAVTLVVQNPFVAVLLLSAVCSIWVVWMISRHVARNTALGMAAGLALVFSKAFVDYSTSGLENPLSHVLILSIYVLTTRIKPTSTFWPRYSVYTLYSMLYLCRPDLVVIATPAVLWITWISRHQWKSTLATIALGTIPALLWTSFSIYYYGFPFPNTAYAKLGGGDGFWDKVIPGVQYIINSVGNDPLTMATIIAGTVVALRSNSHNRVWALGIGLHLLYILYIGGDFMSGRFLTVPLLVAALLFSQSDIGRKHLAIVGTAGALLATAGFYSTLWSDSTFHERKGSQYSDQRGFYYPKRGLLNIQRNGYQVPPWKPEKFDVQIRGMLGYKSIYLGPGTHVIDFNALSDPLLARIPPLANPNRMPGHLRRQLPTNYTQSVRTNSNLLTDPRTKVLYDKIRLVTRGPLNAPNRWKAILDLNLGRVPKVDDKLYRYHKVPASSEPVQVIESKLNRHVPEGTTWDAPGHVRFDWAVDIALDQPTDLRTINLSIDHNDLYVVSLKQGDQFVEVATLKPRRRLRGMTSHQVRIPAELDTTSIVRLTASGGDYAYSVGSFQIVRTDPAN